MAPHTAAGIARSLCRGGAGGLKGFTSLPRHPRVSTTSKRRACASRRSQTEAGIHELIVPTDRTRACRCCCPIMAARQTPDLNGHWQQPYARPTSQPRNAGNHGPQGVACAARQPAETTTNTGLSRGPPTEHRDAICNLHTSRQTRCSNELRALVVHKAWKATHMQTSGAPQEKATPNDGQRPLFLTTGRSQRRTSPQSEGEGRVRTRSKPKVAQTSNEHIKMNTGAHAKMCKQPVPLAPDALHLAHAYRDKPKATPLRAHHTRTYSGQHQWSDINTQMRKGPSSTKAYEFQVAHCGA